ncbi:MAG: GNAT family N-acetyltransferase [Verrucomicrobiota bacterium]
MSKNDLVEVPESKKAVLRQLFELYEYELSPYTGHQVNEYGCFGYRYFDNYRTETDRYAYWIMVESRIAGFIMVNSYCEVAKDPNAKTIAEFFVMKTFRRQRIGQRAAVRVFNLFPGTWEIHQFVENKKSMIFWENVVDEYTSGNFEKQVMITEDGEQQVILFNNAGV